MTKGNNSKKRRRQVSESEKKLEELVFGKSILQEGSVPEETSAKKKRQAARETEEIAPRSAWEDEDDMELEVNLDETDRLKKLKKGTKKGVVSGAEFTTLLKERFQSREYAWTKIKKGKNKKNSKLLQQDGTMLDTSSRPAALPAGKLDIRRLADANIEEPSNKDIQSVRFHANGSLLLAAGDDKYLRFFRIDGETNEKQLSVRFNDMSIKVAEFLNAPQGQSSGEVIIGGRRPYFYSYDTASGSLLKVPGCRHKEIKSHETLAVSPSLLSTDYNPAGMMHNSGYIAVAGAAGYVHLMNGKMKTWVGDVKLSSGAGVRAITFLNDHVLAASGQDAEVYMWDLRMIATGGSGGFISKFKHDDGTCTSNLATSTGAPDRKWIAVGAESGAVSFFNNFSHNSDAPVDVWGYNKQRTVLNLTTKVTCMAFHPSSEVAAIASDQAKDQLKMVHLPSCTVFSNWPTERSPLGRVKCLDFSPGGAFLAQGDHRGRVMLYRLNHFGNA